MCVRSFFHPYFCPNGHPDEKNYPILLVRPIFFRTALNFQLFQIPKGAEKARKLRKKTDEVLPRRFSSVALTSGDSRTLGGREFGGGPSEGVF